MKSGWYISLMAFFIASCSTTKRHYGNYFNNKRYWGAMFVLKKDSTFEFTNKANAGPVTVTNNTETGTMTKTTDSYFFVDSSYGRYTLHGDTVYLTYFTEEIKGDFNGYNIRAKKLFWKGKKLFYFFQNTNYPVLQKEYYMQWSKFKNPNLTKRHENYISKE